nr:YwpF family protein [Pontibacillus yanchengensis]
MIKLNVLEGENKDIQKTTIPLIDGLIINREDEANTWLIEAYIEEQYKEYFETIMDKEEEIVLQAKITKSTNQPAMFLVKVIDSNDIGDNSNILFLGKILDHKKDQVENTLKELIEKGYHGEELLQAFKNQVEEAESTT